MEPLRLLKKKVAWLHTRLVDLQTTSLDLDEKLRKFREPMDFSKLEWRATLPAKNERVWKDECALSFASPFSPNGLFINLKTLTAFSFHHVKEDWERTGKRCVYLRQQWHWIPDEEEVSREEKHEVKKLALGGDGGFKMESEKGHIKKVYSVSVGPKFLDDYAIESAPEALRKLIDAIIATDDASRQMDVLAWEASNEIYESNYARNLIQVDNSSFRISSDPKTWKCQESGLTENLWLNLSTGHIGSGRPNWDGTGGTGAALKHYEETGRKYPLVVKLGTITPDGKADVYSYAADEDCMVLDPLLPTHLSHFGIRVGDMRKTEKTIAEMEVDLNVKYDWSRISEEGKMLEKVSGPRCVGLVNLGNSCYCNSVYQTLFSSTQFADSIDNLKAKIARDDQPQFDLLQQLIKLDTAFRDPASNVRKLSHKPFNGSDFVSPRMLKTLLGDNHRDFSTNEQQDAAEYVRHFLDRLDRAFRNSPAVADNVSEWFRFELEERIECLQSQNVQYKKAPWNLLQLNVPYDPAEVAQKASSEKDAPVVSFEECIRATLGVPEIIDDFLSNATGERGQASKVIRFATYPKLLLIQLRRFVPSATGWEGIKLESRVPAVLEIDLGQDFKGKGLQPGETLLPTEPPTRSHASQPAANQPIVDTLMEQGFTRNGAIRAALATNNNLEAALNWILEHIGDADLNEPLPVPASSASAEFVPDPNIIESVEGMGFSKNGAIRAAKATNNDIEAAINWVMEHMADADFNEPLPKPTVSLSEGNSGKKNDNAAVDEESVGVLMSMGFDTEASSFALKKCQGNVERAADYLFSRTNEQIMNEISEEKGQPSANTESPTSQSPGDANVSTKYVLRSVISHVGRSTSSGHYVAHINQAKPGKTSRWIFFNDEKVVLAQNPPMDLGYVFLYERI